ncbi:hypothetical protein AVEN_19461-1 [Araneus ventricosus]|uniref:Uncharacterized protein n=1 Tax=Araneus ventricosus TaxID=182803 RepID=A0A4Y2C6A8_ARAVE|nr:hypothetical protein AVEN_19461-1 [Araneus ventricosus]
MVVITVILREFEFTLPFSLRIFPDLEYDTNAEIKRECGHSLSKKEQETTLETDLVVHVIEDVSLARKSDLGVDSNDNNSHNKEMKNDEIIEIHEQIASLEVDTSDPYPPESKRELEALQEASARLKKGLQML